MDKISVIVSCFNEEKALPLFYAEMEKQIKKFENVDFEYIFVNDGSSDNTLNVMKHLHNDDPKVRYISFSRNFGKEAAMYAGLEASTGNLVTLMDADLQDPPALLKEMYDAIKNEGYDMVGTRRVTRKGEPPIRSFFANLFYKLINKISQVEMVDGARDFRLMRRPMVDAILEVSEYNRFSKGIFAWVGFKTEYLEYKNVERVAGKTSWNFWQLFNYSLEGIVNFSEAPLHIAFLGGLLSWMLAFLLVVFIVVRTLVFGDPTSGWPSLMTVILFIGGFQLLTIGILGKYIGKVFTETKKRPVYIIKEKSK